jgi:winged helix DNA-binding protein
MDRTLSQRELNRALLARQLLLDRSPAPLPRALERVAGIQAQYAPSVYFGLWSRLRDLDPAAITRGLERRTLVQATLMRSTIHLVARDDYWPLWTAIEAGRRRWWERAARVEEKRMRAGEERLRAALADGPLRRKAIDDLLGKDVARGIGLYVPMVRVPPSGTWERRRADLYAAAEEWIGPNTAAPDTALDLLVTRYLRAFGPATRNDVAGFAGVTVADLAPALERLELRRFADGLLDVPRAPLPDPGTPAPPRLIGTWDAILLVHARRTGVLAEEHRARIFSTKTPHSFPTFLVDGAVAGTWREERRRIRLEPFGRLDAADRRELEAEAERLAAVFWGA